MNIWREWRERIMDRDYQRWRRKQMLVRFGLIILSMVLLSPVIAIYQFFDIRSTLGFICMGVCVLFLLAVYRMLGLIGRPYVPPSRDTRESRSRDR